MTVEPTEDDDQRPGPTPVPPRGGKRKPKRPPAKPAAAKQTGGQSAGRQGAGADQGSGGQRGAGAKQGAAGRSSAAGNRPADNRRAAMAQQKRHRQTLIAAGAIVVVIAVVGVIVGINLSGGGTKSITTASAVGTSSLDSFTSSVSVQEMAAAANNYSLTSNKGAYPQVASDPAITKTGKPTLLYIGAEYCPYCATERWPMVLALSKFGTFKNLSSIHSNATDVYPNTATFSFYKSSYSSPYLTFTSREVETVSEKPLQTLTAAEETLETKYDSGGSIPFVYFNGKATIVGAEYNPQLLQGKSFAQIAADIKGQTSPLASGVIADAGAIVSNICQMTGGKPGNVCKLFPKPVTS